MTLRRIFYVNINKSTVRLEKDFDSAYRVAQIKRKYNSNILDVFTQITEIHGEKLFCVSLLKNKQKWS